MPMDLALHVQLMPNHLPGGAVPTFTRVEMLPTPQGMVVLVATDADDRLTVWLSAAEGYARWTQVPLELADGSRPRVLDFDVVVSADGHSYDLAVLTEGGPDNAAYVWHGVPASADEQEWQQRFASAVRLPLAFAAFGARWSQTHAGSEPRALAAWGTDYEERPGAWWLRFDGHGRPEARRMKVADQVESPDQLQLMTASQQVDGALVEGCFMVSPGADADHRRVLYVVPRSDQVPERIWPQLFVDGGYDTWTPVSAMHGAQWPTGVTIAYFNVEVGPDGESEVYFFNDTAAIEGLPPAPARTGLPAYRPIAGRIQADIMLLDGHPIDERYELVAPVAGNAGASLLRMSSGAEGLEDWTSSTLLAADVATYCACRCRDPHTLLDTDHVLVVYRDGGVELFTKNPLVDLWQRYVLADDRVDAVHEVSSYTVRVQPLGDGGGPLGRGALQVSTETPCTATIQGRTFHLNQLVPAVIALGPGNDVSIVLAQGSLASPRLRLGLFPDVVVEPSDTLPVLPPSVLDGHVADLSMSFTPSDIPMGKLGELRDGDSIRFAVASDGTQPFKDLSPADCDAAYDGVGKLVRGYRAAQSAVVSSRDRRPRAPHDILDDFGNLMAYLWSADADSLDFSLNELAEGLLELEVWVGDQVVSLVAETAEAVAECTDWFLQYTLGVNLDDIVNWLGFVFDWDAILRNKDALARVSQLTVDFLRDQLVHGAAAIGDAAAHLRSQVAEFPDLSPEVRAVLAQDPQTRPSGDSHLERSSNGAAAQWGMQTLQSYGGGSSVVTSDNHFAFASAIEQAVIDQGIVLGKTGDELLAYLTSDGVVERTLLEIFEDVLALLTGGVVDAGEVLALDVLKILELLLDAIDATLDERIDLPVLTSFYEEVLVPGGTLTLRDAGMLATSIVTTVGHKIAFGADLFTVDELAAIEGAGSLPSLVQALEGTTDGTPRVAVGGVVGAISATFKAGYVVFWTLDMFTQYAPGQVRLVSLNLPKVAFDALSWGLSFSWAIYRASLTFDNENERVAANINALGVGTTTFNRIKDAIEASAMLQGRTVPGETGNRVRVGEAIVPGIGLLVCDVLFLISLAKVPIEDCPPDLWNSLVAMPTVHMADSGIYSVLALEALVPDQKVKTVLRGVRLGLNIMRPVLGAVTAYLKSNAARNGYGYPGSAAD